MGRPESFETFLVWVRPAEHQQVLSTIRRCSATIEREPSNRYDRNACRVTVNGRMVGYIPREIAALIAPVMDRGDWTYTITQLKTRKGKDDDGNRIFYADVLLEPVQARQQKSGCGCLAWLLIIFAVALAWSVMRHAP